MKRKAGKLVAIAIVVAEVASVGLAATSASAQDAAQTQRQIKRQQQIILQQQKEILSNQRRLESQKAPFNERSPVTGEPIDESKLPKGLLSGILPSCPLGLSTTRLPAASSMSLTNESCCTTGVTALGYLLSLSGEGSDEVDPNEWFAASCRVFCPNLN